LDQKSIINIERLKMKKALTVIPLTLILSACGTMGSKTSTAPQMAPVVVPPPIAEKADPPKIEVASPKPVDQQTARVANNIPVWYFQTPIQEGYLFGTGTARSRDLSMAKEKALTEAQGKIAESVGGKVTKQTRTFRTEAGSNIIENNSTVTKKSAINVDFTGTEVREVSVNLEPGGHYRVFVLVSLPLGENNQVLKQQMDASLTRQILSNESNAMKELEREEKQEKVSPTPNRLLGEQSKVEETVQDLGSISSNFPLVTDELLDRLRQVESGGDTLAINRRTKAMGPYQFMPDTVQMLHKQGIKFNPFDEKESREAAKIYLGRLIKRHNGNIELALKDYGGFVTKDHSDYVSRIIGNQNDRNIPSSTSQRPNQGMFEQAGRRLMANNQ